MRFRLALLAVLATVVVVAMGVTLTYTLIGRQLVSHQEDDVLAQLDQFARSAEPVTTTQQLTDFTRQYLAGPESQSLRQRGLVLALFLPDRTLSNAADLALEKLPFSRPLLERGEPVLGRAEVAQGTYLIAGRPILLGGKLVGGVEVAAPLAAIADVQRQVLFVLVLVGLLALLAVGGGSWLLLGKALDPVRRMTRTAAAISREDLSRRVEYEGPADEVGELAATLNDMLGRLDDAFRSQDRFISDVSHELRTPLTIMKGHLQVLDRQTEFDPERVREEHAIVLEELDRLNRLVEELLTLARLQRGGVLEWAPVGLDGLLMTLVAQGEHLGDRRWQVDRLPGVTVQGDKDRLTQALLNLMVNALNHTAPGQVVALGGEVAGAAVAPSTDAEQAGRRARRTRLGDPMGAGRGHRHGARRRRPDLRALLPRRRTGRRGPGPGSGHRQGHRRGARRLGDAHLGRRSRLPLHADPAPPRGSRAGVRALSSVPHRGFSRTG